MDNYSLQTVGFIKTCFPEKFGVPRQPLLAPAAKGQLVLVPPFNTPDCVEGLEYCSHLWLSFIFHENIKQGWKPKVRPPRLGGNQKMGVFATRSPFRPNPIGLSAVVLESIETTTNTVCLHLGGVDLVDGTPIIDIKPYVPYTDCIKTAHNNFAETPPHLTKVVYSAKAESFLEKNQSLSELIVQILQQNPQPAYHGADIKKEYKMALQDYTIVWRCLLLDKQRAIEVVDIV